MPACDVGRIPRMPRRDDHTIVRQVCIPQRQLTIRVRTFKVHKIIQILAPPQPGRVLQASLTRTRRHRFLAVD